MKAPVFQESWSEEVIRVYEHDLREMWDRSIAVHIYNQYQAQIELYLSLIEHDRPLRILDVGCAQATLAMLLAEKGHRVTAVDLRSEFLEYAQSRYSSGDIEFVEGDALSLKMRSRFDIIFANQIIEHLVYPERLLKGLGQRLGEDGRLIVTTPNHGYLKNPLPSWSELGDPSEFEHLQNTADGDGHFFAYKAQELVNVAKASGFVSARVRGFESPFVSGHMKFRHAHGSVPYPVLKMLDAAAIKIPFLGNALSHQLMLIASDYRGGAE